MAVDKTLRRMTRAKENKLSFTAFPGPPESIVAQLSALCASAKICDGDLAMYETIEVWRLDAKSIVNNVVDLQRLATPTWEWHHQLKQRLPQGNGTPKWRAVAYAISALAPDERAPVRPQENMSARKWIVKQVAQSALARRIDDCITWLDKYVRGVREVRLLHVPAFSIVAAWLIKNDKKSGRGRKQPQSVVIISCPKGERAWNFKHFYTTEHFLTSLRKLPPIHGLC